MIVDVTKVPMSLNWPRIVPDVYPTKNGALFWFLFDIFEFAGSHFSKIQNQ